MRDEPRVEEMVLVPRGASGKDTAILLLGTAMELGYDKRVIRSTGQGFLAPEDVVDMAFDNKSRGQKGSRRSSKASKAKQDEPAKAEKE